MLTYSVKFVEDEGTVIVTAPDLPEVTTFGTDKDDAALRVVDALEEALAARIAWHEPIPGPSGPDTDAVVIALPTQTALKVRLYQEMQRQGVRKAELARRLHVGRPHVDRLLDLNHASRLDSLDAAFAELGAEVRVEVNAPDPA